MPLTRRYSSDCWIRWRKPSAEALLPWALLVSLLAACSSPTPAAPTSAPTVAATVAAPAVSASPAAAPAAVASAAPSPASAVQTPAPQAAGPKRMTIPTLAYTHDDKGHPAGLMTPATITIEQGSAQDGFHLGFDQTDVGQLGPMWQAAGWMAASVGAFEAGRDPSNLRVSWETKGFIDGPSAGGIMTAAFIADLQGDAIKPDVAMTGTINPDGTIGPVGGIQYKLEAVAKEGKKTMLIPIGERYDIDEETNQTVDVVQKGKSLGVNVQEVSTLAEAYEQLTGKPLPHAAASSKTPDLSSSAYDRLKPKVLDWAAEYQDAMGRFKATSPTVQKYFADGANDVATQASKADKALSQGAVAQAYDDIEQATVGANTLALGAAAADKLIQTGSFSQAQTTLIQNAGVSRVQPLIEHLKTLQPTTPEDAMLAVEAWTDALTAVALDASVQREVQAAQASSDQTTQLSHLFEAAAYQSAQKYAAKAAEDALTFNFGTGTSSGQKVDPQALEDWAGVFRRAAAANLQYFDAVVLDQAAQAAGIRTEVAKSRFEANSFDYQVASFGASQGAQDYLDKTIGKGPAANYAHLGFSVQSYLASSQLVAEHYSLQATTDDNGSITGFGRDRALTAMLDAAASEAKAQVAAVEKSGGDSSLATIAFQAAMASREGDASDKASALRSYWQSSLYAKLQTLIVQQRPT